MLLLRKLTFWLALAGAVSATLLTLRMHAELQQSPPPPPLTPPASSFPRSVGASGLLEAAQENTALGTPVVALVAEVAVVVGQNVRKGDLLVQLDDRDLVAASTTLHAQGQVAEAQWRRAQDLWSRRQAITDRRLIATDELRNLELDVAVAAAQVEAARASLEQNRLLRERYQLRAPRDGTVLQVNVRAGESVSPTQPVAPLILGDTRSLQVRAEVDEQLAARVVPGARAVGFVKGRPEQPIPLEFVRVDPLVIPKRNLTGSSIERVDTRVLPVIFRLSETSARLYVGQQLDLFIEEP